MSALIPIVQCSLVSPGVTRCHKQRLMIMSRWENSSSNQTQVFIYTSNYPALCVHYKALNKDWDEKLKCFCWPSLFRFLNRKIITEAASVKQLLSPPRGHNSCNLHNFARELPRHPQTGPCPSHRGVAPLDTRGGYLDQGVNTAQNTFLFINSGLVKTLSKYSWIPFVHCSQIVSSRSFQRYSWWWEYHPLLTCSDARCSLAHSPAPVLADRHFLWHNQTIVFS